MSYGCGGWRRPPRLVQPEFFVPSLDRWRIVHVNVTQYPTAEWTARQLRQAFMFETAPRFPLRDQDKICGDAVVGAMSRRRNPTSDGTKGVGRGPIECPMS